MITDVRAAATRAAEIELRLRQDYPEGFVPITSQEAYGQSEHKAGFTLEVPYGVASKHISKGTHRIATKEEHEAFRADLKRRNDEYLQRELNRRVALGQIAVIQDGQLKPAPKSEYAPKKEGK